MARSRRWKVFVEDAVDDTYVPATERAGPAPDKVDIIPPGPPDVVLSPSELVRFSAPLGLSEFMRFPSASSWETGIA